jgi:hypothetical protein
MFSLLSIILVITILVFVYNKTQNASLISAIGTTFVSIMAIWGDKIRAIFASPVLLLEPLNFGEGEETKFSDGTPAVFYHLKVVNKRHWVSARNVKVLCKGILRKKGNEANFKRERIFVPQQFTWSPAEIHPITPTITKEDILDLGCIVKGKFMLRFYAYPNNFCGFIIPGEAMRVEIEIFADNFCSKKVHIFEITLNTTTDIEINSLKKAISIIEK